MTRSQTPLALGLTGYAALMLGGLALQRLSVGNQVAWMIFYEGGLMFVFPMLLLLAFRIPLRQGLRLRPVPLSRLLWFAAASVVFCLFYFHLTLYLGQLMRPVHRMVEIERYYIKDSVRQVGMLGIALATVGVVICEETFFRGFLLGSMEKRMPGWVICLVIGVLFSVMHLDRGKLIPIIFAGAWFTYVALRGGSIWTGMVAHYVLNLMAVYLVHMSNNIPRETYLMFRYPSAWWFTATIPAMLLVLALTERLTKPRQSIIQPAIVSSS